MQRMTSASGTQVRSFHDVIGEECFAQVRERITTHSSAVEGSDEPIQIGEADNEEAPMELDTAEPEDAATQDQPPRPEGQDQDNGDPGGTRGRVKWRAHGNKDFFKCGKDFNARDMVKKATSNLPKSWQDLRAIQDESPNSSLGIQHMFSRTLQHTQFAAMYANERSDVLQAKMLSHAQIGASEWLRAFPIDTGLTLQDEEFRWSIRHHLLSMSVRQEDVHNLHCGCRLAELSDKNDPRESIIEHSEHARVCRLRGGLIQRHDGLKRDIAEMFRRGEHTVHVEPRGLFQGKNPQAGPDHLVYDFPRDSRKNLALDVCVSNVGNATNRVQAARKPLHTAIEGEKIKRADNSEMASSNGPNFVFRPAVFESTGAIGPDLLNTINQLSKQVESSPTDAPAMAKNVKKFWSIRTFRNYWIQRFSVSTQRGNFRICNNTRAGHPKIHFISLPDAPNPNGLQNSSPSSPQRRIKVVDHRKRRSTPRKSAQP
jgi:hypothetical protein